MLYILIKLNTTYKAYIKLRTGFDNPNFPYYYYKYFLFKHGWVIRQLGHYGLKVSYKDTLKVYMLHNYM